MLSIRTTVSQWYRVSDLAFLSCYLEIASVSERDVVDGEFVQAAFQTEFVFVSVRVVVFYF